MKPRLLQMKENYLPTLRSNTSTLLPLYMAERKTVKLRFNCRSSSNKHQTHPQLRAKYSIKKKKIETWLVVSRSLKREDQKTMSQTVYRNENSD